MDIRGVNLNVTALITFNVEDFCDICAQKNIEVISDVIHLR